TADDRADDESVGNGQFQGNTAGADAPESARGPVRRRLRPRAEGARHGDRRSDGRTVQPAAAGKCDGQLRQGRAAHSGPDRSRADARVRPGRVPAASRHVGRPLRQGAMSAERTNPSTADTWQPKHNRWAIALTVTLAT